MTHAYVLAPGWLRLEITSAIKEVQTSPYIPQAMRDSFVEAARVLVESDRLLRDGELTLPAEGRPEPLMLPAASTLSTAATRDV